MCVSPPRLPRDQPTFWHAVTNAHRRAEEPVPEVAARVKGQLADASGGARAVDKRAQAYECASRCAYTALYIETVD